MLRLWRGQASMHNNTKTNAPLLPSISNVFCSRRCRHHCARAFEYSALLCSAPSSTMAQLSSAQRLASVDQTASCTMTVAYRRRRQGEKRPLQRQRRCWRRARGRLRYLKEEGGEDGDLLARCSPLRAHGREQVRRARSINHTSRRVGRYLGRGRGGARWRGASWFGWRRRSAAQRCPPRGCLDDENERRKGRA